MAITESVEIISLVDVILVSLIANNQVSSVIEIMQFSTRNIEHFNFMAFYVTATAGGYNLSSVSSQPGMQPMNNYSYITVTIFNITVHNIQSCTQLIIHHNYSNFRVQI